MRPAGDEPWGLDHHWTKTPNEVYEVLRALQEQYRQQHNADAEEVVEDIFVDLFSYLTGDCYVGVSWTAPNSKPPVRSLPTPT